MKIFQTLKSKYSNYYGKLQRNKMLPIKIREEIIKEINDGTSINKISKKLNISKSTIHNYYRKIKGKKYKDSSFIVNFSENEGEIVGIFTGDGSQHGDIPHGNYKTNIHFGSNLDYVNHVKNLYDTYFNKSWSIYKEFPKGYNMKYRLNAVNKKIFNYFLNYLIYKRETKHDTVKLKTLNLPKNFKIGFLRGLVDTDGTVCKYDNRIRVIYYTTSKILAKQINLLLKDFQIKSGVYITKKEGYKDLYMVQLSQKDVIKFLKIIKPYKQKRIGPIV